VETGCHVQLLFTGSLRRTPSNFAETIVLRAVPAFSGSSQKAGTARIFNRRTRFAKGEHSHVSHIVTIQTQVRDAVAVAAACKRLGLSPPLQRTVKLFSSLATGLAVELPGWTYPVVCDLTSGNLKFDNYQGSWGKQEELHRFLQAYAVEKAKIEARRRGHQVVEQTLPSGDVKLTIQVQEGGAA
jgi:hypothetical protein